jgi:hypothetical protein
VLVVGERRHHRRRLAGLLVDPAQHPVVQLHARTMSSASRHAHRCHRPAIAYYPTLSPKKKKKNHPCIVYTIYLLLRCVHRQVYVDPCA